MSGLRAWPRGTGGLFIWAKRRVSRYLFVCGGGGGGGGVKSRSFVAPKGCQKFGLQLVRRHLFLEGVEDKARHAVAANSRDDVVSGDGGHSGTAPTSRPDPVVSQAANICKAHVWFAMDLVGDRHGLMQLPYTNIYLDLLH